MPPGYQGLRFTAAIAMTAFSYFTPREHSREENYNVKEKEIDDDEVSKKGERMGWTEGWCRREE